MDYDEGLTVSVAMVTFNQADLIARAIKGVVKQKVPFRIELIICDDASTDNTYDTALKWQKQYPNIIKVFRNKTNLGLQRNYLEAFRHCSGRYLALCDADDYWCSCHKLRRQIKYMEENPDCAITFHRVINHYVDKCEKSLSNPHQLAETTLADLARGNYITNCSVIYRRSLVDLTALPAWITQDCWPDYPLHMLFARHGYIHYFPAPMAVYSRGGQGAWTAADEYGRLMKAYKVRKLLTQEFSAQPQALSGLRLAIKNILVAMVDVAPTQSQALSARRELMQDFSLTDDQIQELIRSRRRPMPLHRKALTAMRKAVSLMLPLPSPGFSMI